MAKLREEYTDRKEVRHRVEHRMRPGVDKESRERLAEELIRILEKKQMPTA